MENTFLLARGDGTSRQHSTTFLETYNRNHNGNLLEDVDFHLFSYSFEDEDIALIHTLNGERISADIDDKIFEGDDGIECCCDGAVYGMITIEEQEIEALRIQEEGYFYYLLNYYDYGQEIDELIDDGVVVLGDF